MQAVQHKAQALQTLEELLLSTEMETYHPRFALEFRVIHDFLVAALAQGYFLLDVFDGNDCLELEEGTPIAEALSHLYTTDYTRIYLSKAGQHIGINLKLDSDQRKPVGNTIYGIEAYPSFSANLDPELVAILNSLLTQTIQQYTSSQG